MAIGKCDFAVFWRWFWSLISGPPGQIRGAGDPTGPGPHRPRTAAPWCCEWEGDTWPAHKKGLGSKYPPSAEENRFSRAENRQNPGFRTSGERHRPRPRPRVPPPANWFRSKLEVSGGPKKITGRPGGAGIGSENTQNRHRNGQKSQNLEATECYRPRPLKMLARFSKCDFWILGEILDFNRFFRKIK